MTAPVQISEQPSVTAVGHQGARVEIQERPARATSGWLGVLVVLVCIGAVIGLAYTSVRGLVAIPILIGLVVGASLAIVQPGQTRVVQFFGRYAGTVRTPGLSWVLPLTVRRNVSVRVRNFETNRLKVNDADGSPVDIAAIVVWQVSDTAKATYAVDDYTAFVTMQAESALRHVATSHPYDDPEGQGTSLRGSTDLVVTDLAREVSDRVSIAGAEIIEGRISQLAYTWEITQAMLRRKQANAVVAARSRIVEGAVGMVKLALDRLQEDDVVPLDQERTA